MLFQPELRRILAGLGNLPCLVNVREQRENIEVVVDAVERLSEVRIGSVAKTIAESVDPSVAPLCGRSWLAEEIPVGTRRLDRRLSYLIIV